MVRPASPAPRPPAPRCPTRSAPATTPNRSSRPGSPPPGPGPVDPTLDALATLVELLGRRHSLDAFWALRTAPLPFRTLAQRVNVAPPRLSQRLTELREAGLVEVDEAGDYRLTSHGRRLLGVLEPLADWAVGWRDLSPRQRVPRGSAARARDEP